jgi:FKBP-type peptidyl-prolyl cis-trans isomerase
MNKILGLFLILTILVSLSSCASTNKTQKNKMADTITTMSGLRYVENEIGTGVKVESGMTVKVDYAGFLTDGKIFDTSIASVGEANKFDRGGYPFEPIEFVVGKGSVIKGWDEGLTTNMMVGGKRRLIIPPVIPAKADLIFDVHVLSVK